MARAASVFARFSTNTGLRFARNSPDRTLLGAAHPIFKCLLDASSGKRVATFFTGRPSIQFRVCTFKQQFGIFIMFSLWLLTLFQPGSAGFERIQLRIAFSATPWPVDGWHI